MELRRRESGMRAMPYGIAGRTTVRNVPSGVPWRLQLALLVVTEDDGFADDVARAARVDEVAACTVVALAAAANELEKASFHTILVHATPTETYALCETIRSMGLESNVVTTYVHRTPAITALTLESGADDVIVWPAPLSELVARMAAWARRASGTRLGPTQYGDIAVDQRRCLAFVGGRSVALRRTEFRILAYLVRNPERVISPEELVKNVLGTHHAPDSSLVRVHIAHLRDKLGSAREQIRTIRGLGYLLTDAPSLASTDDCDLQPIGSNRSMSG